MPPTPSRSYGWIPDAPDFRDRYFATTQSLTPPPLPPHIDMRKYCGEPFDQGQLGSCTAQALAQDHIFNQRKMGNPELFIPSRLFIYYFERAMEGTINSDAGAAIRDGIKVLHQLGVCREGLWGYDKDFTLKPNKAAVADAKLHTVAQYLRINNLQEMRQCLFMGHPVVIGFSVYESFESRAVAKTGIVPMPRYGERKLGGHAVLVVGYDDVKQVLICMNSWGLNWGEAGFFYLPYGFIQNPGLSDDYWSILHL